MARSWLLLALLIILLLAGQNAQGARAAAGPIIITPVNPAPAAISHTQTPNISATYTDSAGRIFPVGVTMIVDGLDVTNIEGTVITASEISYTPPAVLKLQPGNHTVTVDVTDSAGNHAEYSWGFTINTTVPPPNPFVVLNSRALLLEIGVGAAVVAAAAGGYVLYLKRTRRFTFHKYFATHPIQKEYIVLYIPAVAAFVFVMIGLIFVTGTPGEPLLAPEYVVIIGLFIGLLAFAMDARREKRRRRTYERAFAQFLFEMADAMRGGIDPAKCIVELAKTSGNIMRKDLRIAADGIRMGRPFDVVLQTMVTPMRSALINRYAGLISDASAVGGETSVVVYRAAKDMDDFIKIEIERNNQLVLPVAVLYIAFGVLMAVLFSLLFIAPTLGSINISFLNGNPLNSAGASGSGGVSAASVPRLSPAALKQRFFDLMLINSMGTGVIIGAFTEGKARYGLLHSLALMAATAISFAVVFPG
ncbi:MAG: type II secretion system F family protein [Thermoplasmata archaeon]|nr:type II secretion system F family protein [Thermoplasmata archaeon]